MEDPIRIIFAFILVIFVSFSSGYVKRWNKLSSWSDTTNWDKQRLPCLGDNIILGDGAVFIDQNTTLSSLELPLNSEIILQDGKELAFAEPSSVPNNNCPNQDMFFIGNSAREWLNPLNWDRIENGVKSSHTDGMLFTDRVPCVSDFVTFPSDDAFATRVDHPVRISGMQLSTGNLSIPASQAYFASNSGRLRFSFAGGSITLTDLTCQFPEGCACGSRQLQNAICSKFTCPPACPNSVRPDNDCCNRCGALIKMHTSPGFELRGCELELRNTIANALFTNVLLGVSPVEDASSSQVQILLTDPQGVDSQTIGKKIYQFLLKPTGSTKCPGYNVLFFPTEGGTGSSSDDNDTTIIIAVIISVVVLLLIIMLIFFLWRRSRRGSFGVKRAVLHNEMNIAGVQELDYVDTGFNGDPGQAKGAAFENPVYGEMGYPEPSRNGGGAVAALPAKKPLTGGKEPLGVDNPVYDKEIDLSETASNATGEPGQVNPLYTDLYGDKKPPPDDDEDEGELEDNIDSPEMTKAQLKIELDEELEQQAKSKKKSGRDSEA